MRNVRAVFGSVICFGLAACRRDAAVERGHVLAVVDAGSPGLRLELTRERCTAESCELEVWLRTGNEIRDSTIIEWRTAAGELTRTPEEATSGIGGPLAGATSDSGWTAGQEEEASSIFTQVVRLGPGVNGLLITQVLGFEHVKRRRVLFAAPDGKLTQVWADSESQGPYSTGVAITDRGDGTDRIVRFEGFQPDDSTQTETLAIASYAWSAGDRRLAPDQAPALHTIARGPFPSRAVALRVRTAAADCLGGFLALPSENFARVPSKKTVLAIVTLSARGADSARVAAKSCAPTVPSVVTNWLPRR